MNNIKTFTFTGEELCIDWTDGRQSRLASFWLRDHCQVPASRAQVSDLDGLNSKLSVLQMGNQRGL